jgi:hypothetical protein
MDPDFRLKGIILYPGFICVLEKCHTSEDKEKSQRTAKGKNTAKD